MIDIHCHILPGIDDGSEDLETSLSMVAIAKKQGIDSIIATPHYIYGQNENNYQDIKQAVIDLNKEIEARELGVKIYPGQEIYLDKYSLDLYKEGILGGLYDTRYVLVEFPMDKLPKDALDLIYELNILGAKVIVAHPERYNYIIKDPLLINKFINEECYFQINSHSITGLFGKEIKNTAKILIENGVCDFIASDAHTTRRRKPEILEALQQAEKYNKGIKNIMKHNQDLLTQDENIIIGDRKLSQKKKLWGRFGK
ncbi:MAG: tyrosine-protein phosphatase [Clostridiaceae bacterium]